MNRRTLVVIAAVTALLVIGVLVLGGNGPGRVDAGGPLVPGLAERLNELDRVTLRAAGNRTVATLARSGEGWTVAEREGYPADTARLRRLLITLADARRLEQKTSNPELYHRLGVEDPADEDAGGVGIELAWPDESATVVVGDTGVGGDYAYARVEGESASWLVGGDFELPTETGEWLDPDVLDIGLSRIRSVTIRHADDETFELVKPERDATDLELAALPEGRELLYASVANPTGGALAALELEDVEPLADAPARPVAAAATYRTWDGLVIEARALGESVDDALVTFTVSAGPVADTPADDAGEASDGAEGAVARTEASGDVAADAEALDARLDGWAYRLPGFKREQIFRRMEDLLRDREPASP